MARHNVLILCCAVIATAALGCSEGPAELAVHAPGGTSTTTGGGLTTSSTSISADGVAQGLAAGTAHVAVRSTVDTTQVAVARVTIQP